MPTDGDFAVASLRACPLFAQLEPDALEELAARLRQRRYRRNEVVFHQGDPGDTLHVIAEGAMKIVLPSPEGEEKDNSDHQNHSDDKANPTGKLADAELHFTSGPLEGLKLIGFAIWERRTGSGRNVTFPARQYSINGERRSFALLRPVLDAAGQDRVRDRILEAYAAFEQRH